jgi:hypothetical protein
MPAWTKLAVMLEGRDDATEARGGRYERLETRHPFLFNTALGVVFGALWWAMFDWPHGLIWLVGWPVLRGGRVWRQSHRQRGR